MAGPWEKYQSADGPWTKFQGATGPWSKFQPSEPLHDRPAINVPSASGRASTSAPSSSTPANGAVSGKLEEIPLGVNQSPPIKKSDLAPFKNYLSESASQLAQIPKDIWELFKESTGDEFNSASGLAAQGVANMKRGNPFGVVQDVAGTVQQAIAPLSGAVDTAGEVANRTVDPGFVAGETPKIKSPALETPAGPVEGPNRPAIRAQGVEGRPGFTTTDGGMVNRGEGAALAKETGQAKPGTGGALHTEDLQATPAARPTKTAAEKEYEVIKNKMAALPIKPVEKEFSRLYTGEVIPVESLPERLARLKVERERKSGGAAATPTADILAGTIADREKAAAKAPGFVDHIKSAAKTIQAAFSPETVDASARRAASTIRTQVGRGVRDSEQTAETLKQFQQLVSTYTPQEKLDIIDRIQRPDAPRGAAYEPSAETKPLIDTLKKTFADRRAKLEAAPSTAQMAFIEDYYPQLWKDPAKARQFAQTFGTKEGSSGFTKARSIPTVADGIRAGLEPVTIDPIEGTLRYVENVDRFLATNAVFDDAIDRGDVLWRARGQQPDGWIEVQGRKNAPETGQRPYAPEGWARVYNNFISRPPEGPWGNILQGVQRASNMATQFKLALSAYHATNIAGESIVGGVANAIDELAGGHPVRSLAALGSAPAKWITSPLKGKQLVKAYLHDLGSPEMRKVAELAADANFRVVGKGRVADEYRFSGAGSLLDAYKRGSLRADLASTYRSSSPMVGALKVVGRTLSGTMEALSDPLFKTYIPLVKNGAYFDMLSTWLKAHPEASEAEQVAFAQRAADMIDNRFGEMNHDNIFWSKTQKMLSQAAFLSYSYQMGTVREAGGALRDVAKFPFTREWTPKMSWAVALPVTIGTLGAMVQYLHTGKAPESLRDLFAPQTGAIDPSTGQPEREIIPSYASQFMGAAEHPLQEVENKINPMWKFIGQLATGHDWRGDPIALSTDTTGQAIKRYFDFVSEALGPIQLENEQKRGSNISRGEMFLGARSAPMYLTDPEGWKRYQQSLRAKEDKAKRRHDARHQQTYGGTQ